MLNYAITKNDKTSKKPNQNMQNTKLIKNKQTNNKKPNNLSNPYS